MINADEGPLASGRAVQTPPDLGTEFEIPQGNGVTLIFGPLRTAGLHRLVNDLLKPGVGPVVALIHGTRDEGQGIGVCKRLLFPIPATQKTKLHLPGIQIQLVEVLPVQGDPQGLHHCGTLWRPVLALPGFPAIGQGWSQGNEGADGDGRHPHNAHQQPQQPLPGGAPAPGLGLACLQGNSGVLARVPTQGGESCKQRLQPH